MLLTKSNIRYNEFIMSTSKPKLTRKQKIFVDTFVETGIAAQAAKQAYDIPEDNHQLAASMGNENLSKPYIMKAIEDALPEDKLANKHDELLNSMSLEKLYFDEEDDDELIKDVIDKMLGYTLLHIVAKCNKDGTVISKYAYVSAPNALVQDKALDKAYKILGKYAPEKHVNLNLNKEVEPDERIIALAKKINGL